MGTSVGCLYFAFSGFRSILGSMLVICLYTSTFVNVSKKSVDRFVSECNNDVVSDVNIGDSLSSMEVFNSIYRMEVFTAHALVRKLK